VIRRAAGAVLLLAVAAAVLAVAFVPRPPREVADRPLAQMTLEEGPLRIVAFGTSLTHGETWTDAVRAGLETCLGHPVALDVVALPGAGSDWALGAVGEVMDHAPDLVLMEFAINDADSLDGLSLARSREAHLSLVETLQAGPSGPQVLLMTMSPAHGLRGLVRPRLGAFYGAYAEIAEVTGAGLLDLYPRWLAEARAVRTFPDGIHPPQDTAAAVIVPPLLAHVGRAFGRDCGT
jgi:acyl-CoA thioesterase I